MDHLTWMDWVGLGILAYGLVAGAVRGLINQSTRLIMLVLSLGIAGLLHGPSEWIVNKLGNDPVEYPNLVALVEVGWFAFAALSLLALRGKLFSWLGEPTGAAPSRVVGAALGGVGSLLCFTVFLSAAAWYDYDPVEETATSFGSHALEPVHDLGYIPARRLVHALERTPRPPLPSFIDTELWPDRELTSIDRHPPTEGRARLRAD